MWQSQQMIAEAWEYTRTASMVNHWSYTEGTYASWFELPAHLQLPII